MYSWADRALDWIFLWGWCLPLSLLQHTKSRPLRVLLFFVYVLWALPAGIILVVPMLFCIVTAMFIEIVWGD